MVSREQAFTIATVLVFLSSSILVYLSENEDEVLTNNQSYFYPDLFDRHKFEWNMNGTHSYVLLVMRIYPDSEVQHSMP